MLVQLGLLTIGIALAAIAVVRLASVWLRYRGRRVITCPENRTPAGVRVDTRHVAATALRKAPELRLSSCSRWPERAGCGQDCLAQIAASPADCLVRNIVAKWYEGKTCASCGRPIGETQSSLLPEEGGNHPALLGADQVSLEWNQVPADKLFEVLAASSPLCFACHMANKLVRERPELVVDRSSRNPNLRI